MRFPFAAVTICYGLLGPTGGFGQNPPQVFQARAAVAGDPNSSANAGVAGTVTFTQTGQADDLLPGVLVEARITGLAPNTVHGFHLHENGVCASPSVDPVTNNVGPFLSAGGHYDPGPAGNSNPDANHPFHMGDIPNLQADANGVAVLRYRTSRVTLTPGPLTLFPTSSTAVIVHANPDRGTTGVAGGSGGGRIACGVITRVGTNY